MFMSFVLLFFTDLLRQLKESVGLPYCHEFAYLSEGIDSFFECFLSSLVNVFKNIDISESFGYQIVKTRNREQMMKS